MDPNENLNDPIEETPTGGDTPAQSETPTETTGDGDAAENTEVSAGAAALKALEAKFKDTTVDESILGFGDTFCDWRAPLAKVAAFYAAENPEDADKKYKDANGVEKTADELKAAAEEKHNPTPGKVEKLKKFYSELYPEEEGEGEGNDAQANSDQQGGSDDSSGQDDGE